MRNTSRDNGKASTPTPKSGGQWATEVGDTASAIHHCLNYLARDARGLGMAETANLLEMVAQLALDEAKALAARH